MRQIEPGAAQGGIALRGTHIAFDRRSIDTWASEGALPRGAQLRDQGSVEKSESAIAYVPSMNEQVVTRS